MPHRGPTRPFTARQEEIADGIRQGLTYEEIGRRLWNHRTGRLGVSPHTVADQVEKMARLFDAYHEHELKEHWAPREIIQIYAIFRYLEERALDRAEAAAKAG
jgi:DNA-binding NarL/FixJ family response regulator